MAVTNLNNGKVKYKAISGRLSDDFGFNLVMMVAFCPLRTSTV